MLRYYQITEKPMLVGEFSCTTLSGVTTNLLSADKFVFTEKGRLRYFR